MAKVSDLLSGKGPQVHAIGPDEPVLAAIQMMADKSVGALLVMRGAELAGIVSERDYARKVILLGKSSKEMAVREIMTEKVLYALPEQTVDQAMALMTDKHIRHLPVLDSNKKVLGMVSIRDLLADTISEQSFLIQQLEQYIAS